MDITLTVEAIGVSKAHWAVYIGLYTLLWKPDSSTRK